MKIITNCRAKIHYIVFLFVYFPQESSYLHIYKYHSKNIFSSRFKVLYVEEIIKK